MKLEPSPFLPIYKSTMRRYKDKLWTWLLPNAPKDIDKKEWMRHGGKWIIFDRKVRIVKLAKKLEPYIDSGEIESAKYWNGDPCAINVYSLDRDKEKTWKILERLGAGDSKVWEYDYAWDKNIRNPSDFMYSWLSKFRTILQSYGPIGTLRLIKEILKPKV